MFFINEEQIPFRNIKEAVKAFPDWKIIVNTDIGVYLDGVVKRVRAESSIPNLISPKLIKIFIGGICSVLE